MTSDNCGNLANMELKIVSIICSISMIILTSTDLSEDVLQGKMFAISPLLNQRWQYKHCAGGKDMDRADESDDIASRS